MFLKNVFSTLIMKLIPQKQNTKPWTLEKMENITKKMRFFRGKTRFHLSSLYLFQIGKAQFMPLVAGRLVWVASGGVQKLKTVAGYVERQRRNKYRRNSAKIVPIQSPSLFFSEMGGNSLAEISQQTALIAMIFPEIAGNRCQIADKCQ